MEQQLDEIGEGFCIKAELLPKCKEFVFEEFPDSKNIIILLLTYFKTYLPNQLKKKRDYYNKPIIIDPKDIDLIASKDYGDYLFVLHLIADNSTYNDENFFAEDTEYEFQIDLQVIADDMTASLENMIKFQSVVKTLLVNIQANLGLTITIGNFTFQDAGGIEGSNKYGRVGTYTFSIEDTNYKLT